ncbi:MAG: metallophosphoesterase [Myxococcota bacterium]|nr:metallophosphoesterase [Myxococcota bacterium]
MSRIAVVGDVHLQWGEEDLRYFAGSDYDLVLFVGDLGSYRHARLLAVARSIGRLEKPAIVIPGNHDGPSPGQLAAEVFGSSRVAGRLSGGQGRRVAQLEEACGAVQVSGYSVHELGSDRALIVARPHSMGGERLHFARWLRERYGVSTMEESARRLRELVDSTEASRLVFLAHNGPTGLGSSRSDIWGCDFRKEEGDQGDDDLASAVRYDRERGRLVETVLAGHMHHRLRGGGQRRWTVVRDGVLYVNAARVPRVFREGSRTLRHHVRLCLGDGPPRASQVLVDAEGREQSAVEAT